MPRPPASKIIDREELIRRWGRPRTHRLVFTNGCFDLIHRGHVEYLAAARGLGDLLVVAVNSDASVRALKGPGRPLNREDDRALVLAGLESVDLVTIFTEPTPLELITALRPDVLVKGGDYRVDEIVGAPEVTADGGQVVVVPLVEGRSTTDILNRARERGGDG